ncbi:MAG TPA: magnesium transporter CorA family protein [Saprospiraceae bacterium]|nr:magnesium transporter CorA family protein [Saprospiraceae bacterium]HMQ83049.1 magnesium transporter CorA family protein [Saprospiraceae bacterium]
MIRYYQKTDGKLRELEEPEVSCWINISPPFSHEELEEVAQRFDVPLDFLTDSLDVDERSRYEREDDIRLILLNTPVLNEAEEENDAIYVTVPIGIILTLDHVITITSTVNPVLQLFLDNKVKNFNPEDDSDFVLQILEQNVYRFLTCLKKLNLKRNLIEQELYDSSRNRELKQLLSIEKSLVYFMNSLSANELLKMKMKRTNFLLINDDEDKTDLFEDILIDNSQALEMAKIYTDILNGTMDAYGSIISNNLNITIRRLTLITIILMVPTLVASFYGMNIQLPLEKNPNAIYMIIAVSVMLSLMVAWYFQRKRLF